MCAKSLQLCLILAILWTVAPDSCDPMDCSPPASFCPWDSPGKNTRVGCHFLLQVIFLTQGENPSLLMSPALAVRFSTISTTWEAQNNLIHMSRKRNHDYLISVK